MTADPGELLEDGEQQVAEVEVAWTTPRTAASLGGIVRPADHQRASTLRRAADRDRSLTAVVLLRTLVAARTGQEVQETTVTRLCRTCGRDDHGRPIISGRPALHVSIAHAEERILVALSTVGPVGVDVEHVAATDFPGFEDAVLDPDERSVLATVPLRDRPTWRAEVWTAKEALLKATGHGLAVAPSDLALSRGVVVRWPTDLAEDLSRGAQVTTVDVGHGYAACVALLADRPHRVRCFDGSSLLGGPRVQRPTPSTAPWETRSGFSAHVAGDASLHRRP